MRTLRNLAVALALSALALSAGCSTPDDTPDVASLSDGAGASASAGASAGPSGKPDPEELEAAFENYQKCMEDEGVDVPDSVKVEEGDGGGLIMSSEAASGGGEKDDAFLAADEKCREHLPNGGEMPEVSAEDLDRMLAEAQCMREHGIEVEDPTADNPGLGIPKGEYTEEEIQAAMEACMTKDGPGGAEVVPND